ncbi:hypothetical protein [Vallitalea guaymasensis]|uniref:hypothetical protein n=1 Tax=Vallitalea guaymasensis TaxID=1185412 RepID=UPI002355FC73|nr:hypothetical protein [Vallitalea guaymasensis]
MNRDEFISALKNKKRKFVNETISGDFYLNEFEGIEFDYCIFEADLSGMSLIKTVFIDCTFNKSRLRLISYANNTFENCTLNNCNVDYQSIVEDEKNASRINLTGNFVIELYNVNHGWFEFLMLKNNEECFITESNYVSCDAPKKLLNVLVSFIEKQDLKHERWICWSDEPGANIMKLSHNDENITIEVYDTSKESYKIAFINDEELCKESDKLLFSCNVNIYECIKEFLNLYRRIINKLGFKGFEQHWFEYPEKEIQKLSTLIKGQ